MAALTTISWQPPFGLGIMVFITSVLIRAALLWPMDSVFMLVCGIFQDWKVSVCFTLLACLLPVPFARELVAAAALSHLVLDFGLQITAGTVRLHLSTWAYIWEQAVSLRTWLTLMGNGAMVPPVAWGALFSLVPIVVLLRLEMRWRPSIPPRGHILLACVTISSFGIDPPCCRGDSCSAEMEMAQAANALAVLFDDLTMSKDASDTRHGVENATVMHAFARASVNASRGRGAKVLSRNVVLLTLESVGALHTGLYNPDLLATDSMPFLRSLHTRRTKRLPAAVVSRMYVSEPNTLHSFYASHCGIRPHLGVRRAEWDVQRYHNACLPALLRRADVSSALYSTSKLSLQRDLSFDTVWSSMLDTEAQKQPRYNFLGHDDWDGLPELEAYVTRMGTERFFLSVQTLNTHQPYQSDAAAQGHPYPWGCVRMEERVANESLTAMAIRKSASQVPRLPDPSIGTTFHNKNLRADAMRYARELRCADYYVREVWRILARSGRLADTTLIVTADHGEGFTQVHSSDVGHGGTVYETQARVPLLIVGPGARGLPSRVSGIWSDTSIAHTVLEMMGLARHPLVGSPLLTDLIEESLARQQPVSQSDATAPGVTVTSADLIGLSVLSNWHRPPTHAFMSCAFERACIGLRQQHLKWVWLWGGRSHRAFTTGGRGDGRLGVFYTGDEYEVDDVSSFLEPSNRERVVAAMKAWERTVNQLHEGTKVLSHLCPFDHPYALIKIYTHYTHCCSVKPRRRQDRGERLYQSCHGQSLECSNPPCIDNEEGVTARRLKLKREIERRNAAEHAEKSRDKLLSNLTSMVDTPAKAHQFMGPLVQKLRPQIALNDDAGQAWRHSSFSRQIRGNFLRQLPRNTSANGRWVKRD